MLQKQGKGKTGRGKGCSPRGTEDVATFPDLLFLLRARVRLPITPEVLPAHRE